MLDNFDSFTYNLEHYIRGLGVEVVVFRNNEMDLDFNSFNGIVLSPGPGMPQEAKGMMNLIEKAIGKIPILGVCLGMQAIAVHLGGELANKINVAHGISQSISILNKSNIFIELPDTIEVGLYHSWKVLDSNNYSVLAIGGSDNTIMAIGRDDLKCYGVQFHPESIMTPMGRKILASFVQLTRINEAKGVSS